MELPSGSAAALEGDLALKQASKEATDQAAITQKGYDVGRQNFFQAEQAEAAAPGELEAPITSAGGADLGGVEAVTKSADDITQANNAWFAPVMGAIGGIAGAALGPKK